jgi:hypothetical protein
MAKLISYPFRLTANGSVATIEEGLEYYGEELAVLIKTIPGERELVPEYGISDPTFQSISEIELIEKLSIFGPPIKITSVDSTVTGTDRLSASVIYDEADDEDIEDEDIDDIADDEEDENDYDEADSEFNFSEATDF